MKYEIASFMINPIDKIWKCENAAAIIRHFKSEAQHNQHPSVVKAS
jgi:hypothetical protein